MEEALCRSHTGLSTYLNVDGKVDLPSQSRPFHIDDANRSHIFNSLAMLNNPDQILRLTGLTDKYHCLRL